jgi:hypothetical protein
LQLGFLPTAPATASTGTATVAFSDGEVLSFELDGTSN